MVTDYRYMRQIVTLETLLHKTDGHIRQSYIEHTMCLCVLQEVHLREKELSKTEGKLEEYKRKFAVCRHQQGLLYADYLRDKQALENECTKLREELRQVQGQREDDQVRVAEFDVSTAYNLYFVLNAGACPSRFQCQRNDGYVLVEEYMNTCMYMYSEISEY